MATYISTPRVPFGAISIFRAVSAIETFAGRIGLIRTAPSLASFSPAHLDDMGLSVADYAETDRPGVVARIGRWFADRRANARTLDELSRLTQSQLDDIGLTEGDVARIRRASQFF